MRILVDARGLLEDSWAGVEGYTVKMLEGLKRMYPADEYILFSYSRSRKPKSEWLKKYDWRHYHWSNISMSWWWWGVWQWPKADSLIKEIDAVWCPNIRFLPTSSTAKRIVTVHDLSFEIMPECYSQKRRWWHWHMKIARNLKKSDGIVAVSERTAEDLVRYYQIDRKKIKVIYSGIDVERVVSTRESAGAEYLLWIGTLEPRKNILTLLKTYGLLFNCYLQANKSIPELWLMGAEGELRGVVEEYVTNQKWRNKIRYLGYASENEKVNILAGAKILLYLSYYEGFGFPPLEAMRLGIPVISSFGGSLGEVLGKGAVILNPFDQVTFVSLIDKLLSDNDFRNRMISQGKEVSRAFSWQNSVRDFRLWLDEVANRGR